MPPTLHNSPLWCKVFSAGHPITVERSVVAWRAMAQSSCLGFWASLCYRRAFFARHAGAQMGLRRMKRALRSANSGASLSHAFAPPPCFEKVGRVRTRSPACDVTTSRRRQRGRRTSLKHVTHTSVVEMGVQFLYVVRGVVRAQWLREVVL